MKSISCANGSACKEPFIMRVLPERFGFTGGKDFPCQVILIRIIRLRTTLAMKFGARHGAFESSLCPPCRGLFFQGCVLENG